MVKWAIHPPKKIALSLQPKLERELGEVVKQGIIVPVDEQTDWVNSLVVRQKPIGSLRICLDPKDLNKSINREQYPIPTLDMVTNRLQDATLFSHLDGKSEYWNVSWMSSHQSWQHLTLIKVDSGTRKCHMGWEVPRISTKRKWIKHLISVKMLLQL